MNESTCHCVTGFYCIKSRTIHSQLAWKTNQGDTWKLCSGRSWQLMTVCADFISMLIASVQNLGSRCSHLTKLAHDQALTSGWVKDLPRASTLFIIENFIHFENPMHSKYTPILNKDDFTEMLALDGHQIFNSLRRVFASAILIDIRFRRGCFNTS